MAEIIETDFQALRLLSTAELSREQRDELVWRSILSHEAIEKGEGVHDPEVWERLQSSEPAEVFVMDTRTNKLSVVPHLGLISLLAS